MSLKSEIQGENGFAKRLLSLIPSGFQLAQTAQQLLIQKRGEFIITCNPPNVDEILCELLDSEYQLYLQFEQQALHQLVSVALSPASQQRYPTVYEKVSSALEALKAPLAEQDKVAEIVRLLQPVYSLVEQSFAQSRRTRAGGSAQYQVEFILNQLGYSGLYEKQCVLNGTIDFLFPSLQVWHTDRRRCTILSIKRSLRERYKQVYEELGITKGLTVYLMVTETENEAQKDITDSKINALNQQNIYLVVRETVKQRFIGKSNVLGFNQFFCDELPRLKTRWSNSS